MSLRSRRIIFFLSVLLCLSFSVFSQGKKKVIRHSRIDTAAMELNNRISDSILQEKEIRDTTVPYMVNKVEAYSFTLNRAESFFGRRIDTTGILKSVSGLEKGLNYFRNRLDRTETQMNLRSLNTASVLLSELKETLAGWESSLSSYSDQLNSIHQIIRTVKHDNTLQNDSLNTILHGQMKAVYNRSLSLDSVLHNSVIKINTLRNRVSINALLVKDLESEIAERKQTLTQAEWKQEEAPFFASCPTDYDVILPAILKDAFVRGFRVINIFMRTTWDIRTLNLCIWLLLLVWFFVTLRRVRKKENPDSIIQNLTFLHRSVLLSSLLLLTTYSPFVYVSAPAVYVHMIELIRLILVTVLLFPYLSRIARISWLIVAAIWVFFAIDDILLDSAYGERWLLMIGGVLLLAVCVFLLIKRPLIFKKLENSKSRPLILILTAVQISISIVCNLYGRITLSKIFAFSAADSLVLAVTLKVCCNILTDAVYAQSEVFQNRFFAFLHFVNIKNKLRRILWVVTIFVWTISIFRNLMLFDRVYGFLSYIISKPRSIGSVSFSYASGILFILIIWISSVLSQFVNFFFDERHNPGPQKKTKLGSIALIVRIGIWTAGFFIAVAAAGIPINKISILIGALGVGIGFGLQNLVNNLVSGIILAFERPIQIGDTIEIGGKTGVVQEIGVRSSQVNNGEGANIIIPNGDLLSQQLINWTLHNRNRRIKTVISVPYKSDFRKARTLILDILNSNEKIMRDPKPAVTVENFAKNMVNYEVKFWVPDMSETGGIRNELMLDIVDAFVKNDIDMTEEIK